MVRFGDGAGTRRRDVEDVLNAYSSNVASARLLAHGVSPATLAPVQVQRYDTGSTAARSAGIIGGILGFLFFPAFICGLSAAVDCTAGERERRSLEVLMAQPVRTWELVVGKWLAAAALADRRHHARAVAGARDPVAGCRWKKSACRWRVGWATAAARVPGLRAAVACSRPRMQIAVAMNARRSRKRRACCRS